MAELVDQAAHLTLHGATPLPLSLQTPMSAVGDFFRSGPFQARVKEVEQAHKATGMLHQRIDAVVRAIVNLGKALGGRR